MNMEKKKVDVLEQMQNMTIDLNSKALIEKAEKDVPVSKAVPSYRDWL